MAETGQAYAYTGDNPVNGVDPLGLCSSSGGTFLVAGACHWTSKSWVTQAENTLQVTKGRRLQHHQRAEGSGGLRRRDR